MRSLQYQIKVEPLAHAGDPAIPHLPLWWEQSAERQRRRSCASWLQPFEKTVEPSLYVTPGMDTWHVQHPGAPPSLPRSIDFPAYETSRDPSLQVLFTPMDWLVEQPTQPPGDRLRLEQGIAITAIATYQAPYDWDARAADYLPRASRQPSPETFLYDGSLFVSPITLDQWEPHLADVVRPLPRLPGEYARNPAFFAPEDVTIDKWLPNMPDVVRPLPIQVGWFVRDCEEPPANQLTGRRLKGLLVSFPRLFGELRIVRKETYPAMNQSDQLFVGEDNVVAFEGLQDATTGAFITDATVTWQLTDRRGNEIASGSMSYDATYYATQTALGKVVPTDGNYVGTIEEDTKLIAGSDYYLESTATASGDRVGHRRRHYKAAYHGRR